MNTQEPNTASKISLLEKEALENIFSMSEDFEYATKELIKEIYKFQNPPSVELFESGEISHWDLPNAYLLYCAIKKVSHYLYKIECEAEAFFAKDELKNINRFGIWK